MTALLELRNVSKVFGSGGFFEKLSLDLHVADASRSYHVPLLRSSFGLTTYRGS